MNEQMLLGILSWISISLSLLLLLASAMAVGKHVADLQYQKARKLNGVRKTQSWVNLRTHGNRVLFSLTFITTSIVGLVIDDIFLRIWIGRGLFLSLLLSYTISSILDWIAEERQLHTLIDFEEVNNLPRIRLNLHKLNNQLSVYYGHIEFLDMDANTKQVIEELHQDISVLLKSIQTDIRTMDPSYTNVKELENVNSEK